MSLPEFDIVSPSFHANPTRTLEQIRATGRPFVRLRLPILGKMLICVTHEACGAMLKDQANAARTAPMPYRSIAAIRSGAETPG